MVSLASPDSSRRCSGDAGNCLEWTGSYCSLFAANKGSKFIQPQLTQEEQMDTDRATALYCDVGIERYRDVEAGKM